MVENRVGSSTRIVYSQNDEEIEGGGLDLRAVLGRSGLGRTAALLRSNAKRPSPHREGESLMTHRENRTAHPPKSARARSSIALHGRFSHRTLPEVERDAELRKSQDEAGVQMLGGTEHASSQMEEAGSLTQICPIVLA